MFEKEAEEAIKKRYSRSVQGYKRLIGNWQEGAEFGYNKAFVEADKNLKAVVADFNKANEWHYLKHGDYPPLKTDVLICIKLLNKDKTVKIGSFQQGGGLLIEGFIISTDAVIAWQPLPNLPSKE